MKITTRLLAMGFVLAAVLLAGGTARADSVSAGDIVYVTAYTGDGVESRFTYPNNRYHGDGGGFNLHNVTTLDKPADVFVTFCLEANEDISTQPGHYYQATPSSAADGGGHGATAPDPLDYRTKSAYFLFRENTSRWKAQDVQEAIWYLEGELPDFTYDTISPNAQTIINDAGTEWAAVQALMGARGVSVAVLNLVNCTDSTGQNCSGRAQDLIAIVDTPVPEPASLMLLGSGLVGLAAWRRKKPV